MSGIVTPTEQETGEVARGLEGREGKTSSFVGESVSIGTLKIPEVEGSGNMCTRYTEVYP